MLEDEVDEKYYLSDKMTEYIKADNDKWTGNNDKALINKDIASTINTGEGQRRCDASNYISNEVGENYNLKQQLCNELIKENKVQEYDVIEHSYSNSRMKEWETRNIEKHNEVPTLTTRCDCLGVTVEDKIKIKNNTKQGYLEAEDGDGIDISGRMQYHRGTVQKQSTQTLNAHCSSDNGVVTNLRIRKLTPCECWKLMGFDKEDYEKASKVNSNAQLYKQAGNSIVVNVLEALLGNLLEGGKNGNNKD